VCRLDSGRSARAVTGSNRSAVDLGRPSSRLAVPGEGRGACAGVGRDVRLRSVLPGRCLDGPRGRGFLLPGLLFAYKPELLVYLLLQRADIAEVHVFGLEPEAALPLRERRRRNLVRAILRFI